MKPLYQKRVFENIWKSVAPSKVVALFWKLLLKFETLQGGIFYLRMSQICVCYVKEWKNHQHTFFFIVNEQIQFRDKVTKWVNVSFITPQICLDIENVEVYNEGLRVCRRVIKVLLWRWSLGSLKIATYLYYEWTWNRRIAFTCKVVVFGDVLFGGGVWVFFRVTFIDSTVCIFLVLCNLAHLVRVVFNNINWKNIFIFLRMKKHIH